MRLKSQLENLEKSQKCELRTKKYLLDSHHLERVTERYLESTIEKVL